jgi:hypothetical protein
MQQISSFIMSLKGTKPAGGKEPQGDLFVEEGLKTDSTKTDTSAVIAGLKNSVLTATATEVKK